VTRYSHSKLNFGAIPYQLTLLL